MPENFETFLRVWVAENIGSLGSQTDATNLEYILRVRADELEKAATIKGLYGELAEAARPYGGTEGYCSINLRKHESRHQGDLVSRTLYLKPTRLPGNPADDYEVFDSNRRVRPHHAASADALRSAVVLDDNAT